MAKKLVPSGCPDPMTLAELAKGERINWSKKKDTFDTVAECFGITKEGFMENALQIMNPRISIDKNGNRKIISEKDAEKKIDSLLKAHARPTAAKKEAASKSAKKAPSAAEQRKKIVDVLMRREVSAKEKKEIVKSGELFGVGSNDEVYIASGMKWADKGYFFNETVDWKDICQGAIGDCYFLASLCSIAYVNPFLIKNTTALQVATLKTPTPGRYLKLVAKSEINNNAWTSAAEIGIQAESDISGIINMPSATNAQPTAYYDMQGRRMTGHTANWPHGIYIYNGRKVIK